MLVFEARWQEVVGEEVVWHQWVYLGANDLLKSRKEFIQDCQQFAQFHFWDRFRFPNQMNSSFRVRDGYVILAAFWWKQAPAEMESHIFADPYPSSDDNDDQGFSHRYFKLK